jgi:hypothetical protein
METASILFMKEYVMAKSAIYSGHRERRDNEGLFIKDGKAHKSDARCVLHHFFAIGRTEAGFGVRVMTSAIEQSPDGCQTSCQLPHKANIKDNVRFSSPAWRSKRKKSTLLHPYSLVEHHLTHIVLIVLSHRRQ